MSDLAQALADKQAITEQLYRYCRAVDRLDVSLGHSVFHEDAVVNYGPKHFQGSGHDAINWICQSHTHLAAHSHQVTNILIEVDGDRAGSEAYVFAALRGEREGQAFQIQVWSRYCDSWSRRDGRWAIDRRDTVTDFDTIGDVAALSAPERSRRDPQDPSYAILKAST